MDVWCPTTMRRRYRRWKAHTVEPLLDRAFKILLVIIFPLAVVLIVVGGLDWLLRHLGQLMAS